MNIIYTQEVDKNISKLSETWFDTQTFVLLPERSTVSKSWVEERMSILPEEFKTGHFILLTSGSTGHPKLVIASRKRAEGLVRIIHELQENEPAEETILTLPLSYCYAFVNQWLWAKVFNRRLILSHGFSYPDLFKEVLLKANKAMMCLVASQVPLFMKNFGENILFPGVIRLHFAGGRFPQKDIDNIHKLFPNLLS